MSNSDKIIVQPGKALIFFNKDNYFLCDAIGRDSRFFNGNIIARAAKLRIDELNYHKNVINYFLNNVDFELEREFYLEHDSAFLLGNKDFNRELIPDILLKDNLFLFNFSNNILLRILNNALNKAICYFSKEGIEFDIFYLEKHLSSQSAPYENKIENSNCTQSTLYFKNESAFFFLKKNAIVIDLGDIDKSFLNSLIKSYNVYIINPYLNFKEIKDLRPDMIFISDGHGDLEQSFCQLYDLIKSVLALKIRIVGFGFGFMLLARYTDRFRIDECKDIDSSCYIFDKKMIMFNAKRIMYWNIRLKDTNQKKEEYSINIIFSFLKTDLVAGFRCTCKKKSHDISGFLSTDMYLKNIIGYSGSY